MFMFIELAT